MKTTAILFGLLASTQALAHPGHDHAFWTSDAIHALTALAVVAVAAAAVKVLRKPSAKNIEEK